MLEIVSKLEPADLGTILDIIFSNEEVHLADKVLKSVPLLYTGKAYQISDEARKVFYSDIQVRIKFIIGKNAQLVH